MAVPYSSVRAQLKTGDLIFMKRTKHTNYTRVGMVVLSNIFPVGSLYRPVCMSTGAELIIPYVFDIGPGFGSVSRTCKTHLESLDSIITRVDKDPQVVFAWGQLSTDLNERQLKQVYDAIIRYSDMHYTLNVFEYLAQRHKKCRWMRRLVCTTGNAVGAGELLAQIFVDCGALSASTVPENVIPHDFIADDDRTEHGGIPSDFIHAAVLFTGYLKDNGDADYIARRRKKKITFATNIDDIKEAADKVTDKVGDIAAKTANTVVDIAEKVADKTSDIAGKVIDAVTDGANTISNKTTDLAAEALADVLEVIASAADKTAGVANNIAIKADQQAAQLRGGDDVFV